MVAPHTESRGGRRRVDPLLSWDHLGFRLVVFGGIAVLWVITGALAGQPWLVLAVNELGGMLPWAFLAPLVLRCSRRVSLERVGWRRTLRAHGATLLATFVPWWVSQRVLAFAWALAHGSPAPAVVLLPTPANLLGGLLSVPFAYFLILLGAKALTQSEARHEEERRVGRLSQQLAQARLVALQHQLHPHFLFNALQAVSTLLHRDPATADALLVKLSTLLRSILDDASTQSLTLAREIELTRTYLDIEQARFGDRLTVEWAVDQGVLGVTVPALVLLPLVENAIRHGLAPKVGQGRLVVRADAAGDMLVLAVEDDGLGVATPVRPGVGIGNTAERLRALHGDRAELSIDSVPGRGFKATIRVPVERAA
jgi:two-component system, LytTR family, sensor kinase